MLPEPRRTWVSQTGVLGGGWSLVVGWIVPATLNVLILSFLVIPQIEHTWLASLLPGAGLLQKGVVLLTAGAVLGLLLAAIQTPIYRLLEGYVGWRPKASDKSRWEKLWNLWASLLEWSYERQLRRKQILSRRLDLAEITPLAAKANIREELQIRLDEARKDRRVDKYSASDAKRGASQLALLREQVRRYPVSDQQVAPTRLGNAIRRMEEYGSDRYRLDSQSLWYELMAVAPEQSVKDVERARVTVDFMVSLLAGHVVVAVIAGSATLTANNPWVLALTAVGVLLLARLWYLVAISSTDDWAAAVRSLVNLGRKPLSEALGLRLPASLEDERELWAAVSRISARPFDLLSLRLDRYRTDPDKARDIDPSQKSD